MSATQCEIRSGVYYDSVMLMQLQRTLAELPGVQDAGVVMATPANRALLLESALLPGDAQEAGPDDLLIVVRAETDAVASEALAQVDALLARRRTTVESQFRPRSLDSAARLLPGAQWVLVSVPGKYAAGVARQALDLGKHVFLYSDNVSLQDEIALKHTARAKGLLVMGPDCGTAIINGVGLGFANRVRRGKIGLVGASGTGLQAISSHIHNLGAGISHAIGTGGRDLSPQIGAITAHQALDLLGRDPQTEVIVLVSKPPAPDVAAGLLAAAHDLGKDVVVYFVGQPPPANHVGTLSFVNNLQEAAVQAAALLHYSPVEMRLRPNWQPLTGHLRGLFSGGTLAYEALLGLQATLTPLYSNVALDESQHLKDAARSQGHTILDLGADEFTVGRLHPMMDNDLRLRRLRQEADDPDVGLMMLDVVLGDGAHPDPAAELAPAIAQIKATREIEVVAIVIGTDDDPQDAARQVAALSGAGATVFRSVSEAVEYVGQRLRDAPVLPGLSVPLASLQADLAAINVGLESFYESLCTQGADAVHVDWRPPAGGDERLMSLLAKMNSYGQRKS